MGLRRRFLGDASPARGQAIRRHSVFGSSIYMVDSAKWLFPQEKATLHDDGVSTYEPETL
jgi:hypothetical protein